MYILTNCVCIKRNTVIYYDWHGSAAIVLFLYKYNNANGNSHQQGPNQRRRRPGCTALSPNCSLLHKRAPFSDFWNLDTDCNIIKTIFCNLRVHTRFGEKCNYGIDILIRELILGETKTRERLCLASNQSKQENSILGC